MNKRNSRKGLEEVVSVGLACVAEGLDSKETVKDEILDYVNRRYVAVDEVKTVEDIPLRFLAVIQAQLGVGFEVHGGKVSRAVVEPNYGFAAAARPDPLEIPHARNRA